MTTAKTISRTAILTLLLLLSLIAAGPLVMAAPLFPERKTACWGREYTTEHLARHPAQAVQAIYLWDPGKSRRGLEQILDPVEERELRAPGSPDEWRVQLYVELRDGVRLSGAIRCREATNELRCERAETVAGAEGELAAVFRLAATDLSARLDLLVPRWPAYTLADHTSRANLAADRSRTAGPDDRSFRLDMMSPSSCAAAETRFAHLLTSAQQPSILSRIVKAAGAREPEARRLCLTGNTTDTAVALYVDTGLVDWPVGPDTVSFRVAQMRNGARAISRVACAARDYAWRCDWQRSDEESAHRSNLRADTIAFREGSGVLVRHAGGALLRSIPCLTDTCDTGAPGDLALQWSVTSRCDALR